VLTRSFFMGSQKYGAFWTGDNKSTYDELQGSVIQLLQMAISGFSFGGADVPGFYGGPEVDLYIMFYQLGAWYPFFRAHSHIENTLREPWIQRQRI